MSRATRLSLYAGVVVVVGLELAVASLVFSPKVSAEYRAYYIDHSTDCWISGDKVEYPVGQVVSFGSLVPGAPAGAYQVCGWSRMEGWGSWTDGPVASLRFQLPRNSPDLKLTISGRAFAPAGFQKIEARVNGKSAGVWRVKHNEQRDLSLQLPRALTASGQPVRVDFLISKPQSPKQLKLSHDARRLGFGVSKLMIDAS